MQFDVEPESIAVEPDGSIDVIDDVTNAHGAHDDSSVWHTVERTRIIEERKRIEVMIPGKGLPVTPHHDPVDPRITRTRQIVLAAVVEELAQVGHSQFTIESVAARCGVGKSTIYRHWDGKRELIADAMRTLNTQPAPQVDGSPRERTRQLLHHLIQALTEGVLGPAIPALVEAAERDHELRELVDSYSTDRRRALVAAIAAGVDAGLIEQTVDPELAAQALSGAIFYARLMTSTPMSRATVDQLMITVLGPPPD